MQITTVLWLLMEDDKLAKGLDIHCYDQCNAMKES